MSERSILAVGIDLASDDVTQVRFDSNTSLLDWDIVLFEPDLSGLDIGGDWFQGKKSFSDYSSFKVKERSEHWRREIKDAVESGKTVVVFLPDLWQFYVDTGKREHSGSGRSRQT